MPGRQTAIIKDAIVIAVVPLINAAIGSTVIRTGVGGP